MGDEQKALAAALHQLAANAARLADSVLQLGRAGDALDDLRQAHRSILL